jgi:hypothetical protein
MKRFRLASKKEDATNNVASTAETNTVQSVQKTVNNSQQQQVAIPKRKRRDRIPERPNYRYLYFL